VVIMAWMQAVMGSMQDCWDPDKLARMNFKQTPAEAEDPGLDQFSKMVKCLEILGDGGANRQIPTDWNLWGRIDQKAQNNANNIHNNYYSQDSTSSWDTNPYNVRRPDRKHGQIGQGTREGIQNVRHGIGRAGVQPKPGVHPDDWGRVNTNQRGIEGDAGWTSRHGSGNDTPPGWSKDMTREERRKLKRDQRRKQVELEKRRKVHDQQHGAGSFGPAVGMNGRNRDNHRSIGGVSYSTSVPPEEVNGGGMNGFLPPVEISNDVSDSSYNGSGGGGMQGELTAVSLERKYSYAIMALSVVVLAVLMVATIFCCNSSNSTMAQAANARAALATQNAVATAGILSSGSGGIAGTGETQFDNYSIYSYKGGSGTMGTYPATHAIGASSGGIDTLGGMSLRTETLKSTRSMASRTSPQYRVSDIDPDFSRRFDRDNHHHY